MTPHLAERFNYGNLEPELAIRAERAADWIRRRVSDQVKTIIEVGRLLIEMKAELGHGNFGRWIEQEFEFSRRTGELYMAAAERYGDKSEMVSRLSPSTVYLLAAKSTPDAARDLLIARVEEGDYVSYQHAKDFVRRVRGQQSDAAWSNKELSLQGTTGGLARNIAPKAEVVSSKSRRTRQNI